MMKSSLLILSGTNACDSSTAQPSRARLSDKLLASADGSFEPRIIGRELRSDGKTSGELGVLRRVTEE